jgi:hypothetical protein
VRLAGQLSIGIIAESFDTHRAQSRLRDGTLA